MAARGSGKAARRDDGLFSLAERQVLDLYDAGVLSPAVLHRVIAAYTGRDIDWHEEAGAQSVDGRSVHEVVVLTMMPGRALRNAKKDFLSVIEHLTGDQDQPAAAEEEPADEDDELLNQLSGAASKGANKRTKPAAQESASKKSPGFNPLVQARALRSPAKS